MRAAGILIAALTTALVVSSPAYAFTMEPMSTLLAPTGAGSVATFRITNDGTERTAIRVSVLNRAMAPDGTEENSPAGSLFIVYPARLLVEPGATAAVKIQWRGPANLAVERSFRFVAEELALSSSGAEKPSGIRMLFRYVASVYVGETGFVHDLEAKATGSLGPKGQRGIFVEIENRGKRHIVALGASLELSDGGGKFLKVTSEELGDLSGANYLPGGSRRLFIAREDAQPERRYDARIDYEGEY